jgi:hypothetical protein
LIVISLNFKLQLMNTTTTFKTLQPGQSLALPARRPQSLVLVEGEVLVQAPAQWLGGALVLSQPVRVTAPHALDVDAQSQVVASSVARIAIEETQGVLAFFAAPLRESHTFV